MFTNFQTSGGYCYASTDVNAANAYANALMAKGPFGASNVHMFTSKPLFNPDNVTYYVGHYGHLPRTQQSHYK